MIKSNNDQEFNLYKSLKNILKRMKKQFSPSFLFHDLEAQKILRLKFFWMSNLTNVHRYKFCLKTFCLNSLG